MSQRTYPSSFFPDADVKEFNIKLGKSKERSDAINAFFRAVMHGGGTVYVPGKGTYQITKKEKRA